MELKNFSCRKKKKTITQYSKSLNNIDHLKKEWYIYLLPKKKRNNINQMHLSSSKNKKIKIIERYICRDGEMKNNFRNNTSSMF